MKKCKHVVVKGVHKASGEKSVLGYILPSNGKEFFEDIDKVSEQVYKGVMEPFDSLHRDRCTLTLASTLEDPYGTAHVCIGDYSCVSTEFVYQGGGDTEQDNTNQVSKNDWAFLDEYLKSIKQPWK